MEKARFDWLVELGGALTLAAAAAYSAFKAAPSFAWPAPVATTVSGFAFFGLAMVTMKAIRPAPRQHRIAGFDVEPMETELLLDDPWLGPLLLDDVWEEDVLLLEDRLSEASPDSRVVRLFAFGSTPTPGELKDRIDQHLAGVPRRTLSQMSPAQPDAAQALYAALSELKRSLR